MNIRELMDGIRKMDMVLPEFQREFVWHREQAKQLMVSLFRGYPTGALLFWKTDSPPDIKNSAIPKEKVGTTMVMLDGQQRLTTLYLFTQDQIPPYYREDDIVEDPRNLYFDLETGDFQYYQAGRMHGNPTWIAVMKCFTDHDINLFQVAESKTKEKAEQFKLAQLLNANLTTLRNILEKDYPIQTVPSSAGIDEAIDVFDRVNSLGTKLTEAELALAHICGKWPQARQVMKDKIRELGEQRFYFDLTFVVRCLTGVVKGRALFETIHGSPATELKDGWKNLSKILDYLTNILPKWARVHSSEDLNSTNVLVPAVVYLAKHGGKFSDEKNMRQFIHWMYAANSWGRYTSQTDQRLDSDISLVLQNDSPWRGLVEAIIDQRGRIELKSADLEGRAVQHPLYRILYIMCKTNGAVDWFNGMPLEVTHGNSYTIHSHHIFPTSLLYKDGKYDEENHLHRKIVNEIANRGFLTGESNIDLKDEPPSVYLPRVQKKYPGALQKQLIPLDPALWETDRFEDFLRARRELIANAFNELMASLLDELEPSKPIALPDLIRAGEGPTLEFKSSFRWDVQRKQANKDLQKEVARSLAGFMNSEGGTLLIGVGDDGGILGIEDDIKTLGRKDHDGFMQAITNHIVESLGAAHVKFVHPTIELINDKAICVARAEQATRPAFLADGNKKEFYVRAGNTTRLLDAQETHEYIGMHWES